MDATSKKATAPAAQSPAGTTPTPLRAQKLRQVLVRKFAPSSLQSVGHDYDTLTVTAGVDWTFADCLNPDAWSSVANLVARDALNTRRDKLGSLIEVRHAGHQWFAVFYIRGIRLNALGHPDGLDVVCIGPAKDPKTGKACPIDLTTGGPLISQE